MGDAGRPVGSACRPRRPPRSTRRRALAAIAAAGALSWWGRAASADATGGALPAPIAQPPRADPQAFAARALALRDRAVAGGDQPYGAVVVRDGAIVGEGRSEVVTARDPTAHAEMLAIRDAMRRLGTADLAGCVLYGSSRACPMCEAAAHRARIARLAHGPDPTDDGPPRPSR
jgi:tRNA(Arg) A34 adenosine deaminase TadA